MKKVEDFFDGLTNDELISSYNVLLTKLKSRNIIRTNNLVGDLGEFIAINYYNNNENLPNLIQADTNETAYDAVRETDNNIKYAIKASSTNMTGIFWGLEPNGSENQDEKIFDYVIVVRFGSNYRLESIYQITWEQFLKLKSWHSTTKAWKLQLNKEFIEKAERVF